MPHNQLVKKKLVNCWHSMDHRFAQNSNTIEEILFTDLNFHDSKVILGSCIIQSYQEDLLMYF